MGFEFDGKISIQRFQAAQTEVLRTRHQLPDEETAMFKHAVVHESLSLLKDALERLGYEPAGGTPDALGSLISSQVTYWTKVVKDSGIRMP
jgi:tripartite-type tricarboxylate transporter receptor subunit TctC